MEQREVKGNKPDYKGTIDVAAWFNKAQDGNTYLAVVLGNRAKLVPNGDKIEEDHN